ncbi:hypothetical protein CYQ88_04380 [Hydrogenovibrio sp. SC-1]|uniref:hypothetical protein n=1 Tax=Hydrogenovibrio sp. SC-1 TaxID=2065820 RepID=UPI000C7A8B7C|nr:hypothetical protein [Hydrogenovibrio sp. SC-1]PLA74833.1 hypothetical protein CYQ88_04380 [Hydrogenovibrio sp. SC-1]
MAAISPSEGYTSAISNKSNGLEGLLQAKNKADQLQMTAGQNMGADTKDRFDGSAKGLQAYAATEKFQQSYAYSQTMTLALTTQQGDEVRVDFRQLYVQYQQTQQSQAQQQGPEGVRYFESRETLEATAFEERFGFSIEGDLNEAELNAVFDVFKQVDRLATEFFNGDIEKAFEKAQALNVDFGQLSSVSLDLNKKESAAVSYQQAQAYQSVESNQANESGAKGQISQLPPYLKNWQEVIQRMDEQFADARDSFDKLMAGSLTQRSEGTPGQDFSTWYDRVSRFHDKLAEVANLDKKTLKPSNLEVEPLIQSEEALAEKATEQMESSKESADESLLTSSTK